MPATRTPAPDKHYIGEGSIRILPGQYTDRETNTNYNYHRDYDPQTGRYLQSDPIGLAGGIGVYLYVGGNPLGRVDPPGLDYVVMTGMMNAAQRGEWPNCQCKPNPTRPEAVIKKSMLLGAGTGTVAGGVTGLAVGAAHAESMGVLGGLAVSESVGAGMVAGGVLGAATFLVVGGLIAAVEYFPNPACPPCDEVKTLSQCKAK